MASDKARATCLEKNIVNYKLNLLALQNKLKSPFSIKNK
jgi:hypothetical protein